MSYKVDNAIILAAGTSSRFAPLSYEKPKGLTVVKGEVLIERQIRQLHEAGIKQIILVVGYKKECFEYLKEKYGVQLVENPWYDTRNNNASIQVVRDYLRNSFICSSDNYLTENPFESAVDESYYSLLYAEGSTNEWCVKEDEQGYIADVKIGGENAWYMLGHTFWSQEFCAKFLEILDREYDLPETADKLWEKIYIAHLDELKMKARHYPSSEIFEFDTMDELRQFDESYIADTRSAILKEVAKRLNCQEKDITKLTAKKDADNSASGFAFEVKGNTYEYTYKDQICVHIDTADREHTNG